MSNDLRRKFLNFFETKQHLIYPSAPLRSTDPGLLFNVAGMQQFKAYFQGATPRFPGYGTWHRVTTSQKCMRAGGKDSYIENVGRTRRHQDRKSTRLNSSHVAISYAVFCLKKKKT